MKKYLTLLCTRIVLLAGFGLQTSAKTSSAFIEPQLTADLSITSQLSTPGPYHNGENVTITLTAGNAGPDNASGVLVTDLLPSQLTFLSVTATSGAYNSGSGTWTIGTLTNGGTATLVITAKIITTGTINNCAQVTGNENDADMSNNSTCAPFIANLSADLSVTSQYSAGPYNNGANVTCVITVNNAGPDNASSVLVTDLLPSQLIYESSTPTQGTYNAGTGYWVLGNLVNGSTATLVITAKVNTTGTINNCAQVTANEFDADTTNNNTCKLINTQASADVSITSQLNNGPYRNGENVTITLTAANAGPDGASGVSVADLLPAKLTYISSTASKGTYSYLSGNWTIGSLVNGSSEVLTITATVNTSGNVSDCAQITANEYDPAVANNNACNSFSVVPTVNLAVTKTIATPPPYTNGETITYNIIIANNGADNSTGTLVTDALPAGLAYVGSAAQVGSYNHGTGVWIIGTLANNTADTLKITAKIDNSGAITNCATASSNEYDTNTGDDQSCVTITAVNTTVNLSVTKTVVTAAPYLVNEDIIYKIDVHNNSANNASGVIVSDVLPKRLIYVTSTTSIGFYDAATGIWYVGNVAAGQNQSLYITASPDSAGNVTNCAIVNSNEADTDSTDNYSCATINVSTATGINNLVSDKRILVFPNPANAELIVKQGEVGMNSRISMINALGQTVLLISKPGASQLIDVSGIANGIYQLKIENDNNVSINKIVIQH